MVLFTTPSESSWLTLQNEWGKIVEGVDMGDGNSIYQRDFETFFGNKGLTIYMSKEDASSDEKLLEILEEHFYSDLDNSFRRTVYEGANDLELLLIWTDIGSDVVGIVKDCGIKPDGQLCAMSVVFLAVPGVSGKIVKPIYDIAIKKVGIVKFTTITNKYGSSNVYKLLSNICILLIENKFYETKLRITHLKNVHLKMFEFD